MHTLHWKVPQDQSATDLLIVDCVHKLIAKFQSVKTNLPWPFMGTAMATVLLIGLCVFNLFRYCLKLISPGPIRTEGNI